MFPAPYLAVDYPEKVHQLGDEIICVEKSEAETGALVGTGHFPI
jgi:hypothetical protein